MYEPPVCSKVVVVRITTVGEVNHRFFNEQAPVGSTVVVFIIGNTHRARRITTVGEVNHRFFNER